MYTVLETQVFASWVDSICDTSTGIRLRRRVNRARMAISVT